jgi:hypothetical protein
MGFAEPKHKTRRTTLWCVSQQRVLFVLPILVAVLILPEALLLGHKTPVEGDLQSVVQKIERRSGR